MNLSGTNASGGVEVVLLIACFNGRRFIGECLDSLLQSGDVGIEPRFIVIDNASADGSAAFIVERYPAVRLMRLEKNVGFTGAINAGWEFARREFPTADYVGILNQDIVARPGWLGELVRHLQENSAVAAVQPKVYLWPPKDQFNTAGNRSHYLGFGLVTGYAEVDTGQYERVAEIDFPSGAATVLRRGALGDDLPMEEDFFLYHEDTELGWRLRQEGYRIDYVPGAAVWHQYSYRHDYRYYFFLERNRWYLLGLYYKTGTLALLLPAIVAMEMGQIYFAWRNGVLGQKLKAMGFFLSRSNFRELLRKRRMARRRRRISDRTFTRNFTGVVELPELRSGVLRWVGNPLLSFYWKIVRHLIFW